MEHDRVTDTRLSPLRRTLLGLSPSEKRRRRRLLSGKAKLLRTMSHSLLNHGT